jgi:hypothetical protein
MYKNVDYEYYGFIKGDAKEFLENEEDYEAFERQKAVDEWILQNTENLKINIK